jgi:hypothetical protein
MLHTQHFFLLSQCIPHTEHTQDHVKFPQHLLQRKPETMIAMESYQSRNERTKTRMKRTCMQAHVHTCTHARQHTHTHKTITPEKTGV